MCGIFGYIGEKKAYPILLKGLGRMEYRGYDSSGIALLDNNLNIYKRKGKLKNLEEFIKNRNKNGFVGIGHTRWATHGAPSDKNAHPHLSKSKNLAIVHNGIIENHNVLKSLLLEKGYSFKSDTDTEVIAHLIEDIKNTDEKISLFESVRLALNEVVGAYAIAVVSKSNPDEIIVAKNGSPLAIGIKDKEYYVASDASGIIEHTNKIVYLKDKEIAVLSKKNGLEIKTIKNKKVIPYIQELELKLKSIEKSGFKYFMLKEIFDQPLSIKDSLRGRLDFKNKLITISCVENNIKKFINAKRIIFIACGTSFNAALVGEYIFENLVGIPVEVEYASEFKYRNPPILKDDIVIAISQSGETADTIVAIELAKSKGAKVMGICNVAGSSISRITDFGMYTHAGVEIGVASTKAFTAQVALLTLLAIDIAKKKEILSDAKLKSLLIALNSVPKKMKQILDKANNINKIARKYKNSNNAIYLGRGYNFPVALEGALKLKEISYVHAEGHPASEMKHGHIALVDKNMPVVVIATSGALYEKMLSNIQEVKARGGKIIAIVDKRSAIIESLADDIIEIPQIDEMLSPLLSVIPTQLLAYNIAVMRGCNVDQPRNLAKSVTVE